MSPRPDVSEDRKRQITEAAIKVFSRKGIEGARMDDIAEESGLSKGALYWYFKGKEEIVSTILSAMFDREFEMVEKWRLQEGSASEKITKMTDMIADDLLKMRPFMPVLLEFWAMSFRKKKVSEIIRGFMYHYLDLLTPIIQQGIDEGEFRPVNAKDAAMSLGAVMEGSILLWTYDIKNVEFDSLIKKSVEIYLAGIAVKG